MSSSAYAQPRRPARPPKPARPPRPPRPEREAKPWLLESQQQALVESSLNAPHPSALLFWCEDTCSPFATLWLERKSEDSPWTERVQRLPGRKLPRPRPEAGDARLQMQAATQIGPESWLAMTGTPHPEPGEGVLFGRSAGPNSSGGGPDSSGTDSKNSNSSANTKGEKRKSRWSALASAELQAYRRTTSGSSFYQQGFERGLVPSLAGDLCVERWSHSKWSLCAQKSFSVFGNLESFESLNTYSLSWAQRLPVLANHGFGIGAGYYTRRYQPPSNDPLNTSSQAQGVVGQVHTRLPQDVNWWTPELHFNYHLSLSGKDPGELRGESLTQTGMEIGLKHRLASSPVWKRESADYAFRIYAQLFYTQWNETSRGDPKNPLFPAGTSFGNRNMGFGISASLEEVSW